MDSSIILRSINKTDYNAIADIISDTWKYKDFCSEKTAHKMGLLYISSCLCSQTFNKVALKNNEIVGVIMGNDNKNPNTTLKNRIFFTKSYIKMCLSKEGRKVVKTFRGINGIDKKLLNDSRRTFDSELAFFAVKDNMRGTGVGNALYASLMDYFKEISSANFYLFTDTTCNFGFYEHKGISRIGEKTICLNLDSPKNITFYIYANEI